MQRLARMRIVRLAESKVWGTPVNFKSAREIYPTDMIGPGGYAGIHVYQQTEQTIPSSVYQAFVNGSMQQLRDEIHKAIPNGPTIKYMQFTWNVVSGTTIRDCAVGFVMTADQQFTGQQVIEAARTVAWFRDFFDAADMGITNVWLLEANGGFWGIPWEWIVIGGVVVAVVIAVAVMR